MTVFDIEAIDRPKVYRTRPVEVCGAALLLQHTFVDVLGSHESCFEVVCEKDPFHWPPHAGPGPTGTEIEWCDDETERRTGNDRPMPRVTDGVTPSLYGVGRQRGACDEAHSEVADRAARGPIVTSLDVEGIKERLAVATKYRDMVDAIRQGDLSLDDRQVEAAYLAVMEGWNHALDQVSGTEGEEDSVASVLAYARDVAALLADNKRLADEVTRLRQWDPDRHHTTFPHGARDLG